MRGICEGLRNFEPWSNDRTTPELALPSPNFQTSPTVEHLSLDIFKVHQPPLHDGSSAVLGSNHDTPTMTTSGTVAVA
ncbi:hypothetical protein TNCV_2139171 [Trichonephila clavipes]|uniref:Uncharacterized protein n=1 Tax=Trichonephila clavipes TaxID=2585209 RepID=A0A8X6RXC4_TRICX|nr:hypothetical protein TNCV_2139171 [Trichonephila clavipes]